MATEKSKKLRQKKGRDNGAFRGPVKSRGQLVSANKVLQAEIAERERTEAGFRAMLEAAPDGVVVVKRDGKMAIVNRRTEEMFGYSRDELLDQPVEMLLPERFRRTHLEHRAHYLSNPSIRPMGQGLNFLGRRKDASEVPIEISLSPLIMEDGLAVISIIRDITERKRAEERLRQSEEEHRLLFEMSPHPMWVFDRETLAFLTVNEAAVRHYGYSREEFLAMTIKDIRPSQDIPALLNYRAEGDKEPAARDIGRAGLWKHRKKDGTLIDVEVTRSAISFKGKEAVLILANDITARKQAQEALRRARNELEFRVAERTADLMGTNRRLQEEISERKLAQEALAKSEALLAKAQELAHLGSYEMELTTPGRDLWSREMFRIVGLDPSQKELTREEYIERIVHPDDRIRAEQGLERAIKEIEPFDAEYRIITPSGVLKHVHSKAQLILDDAGNVVKLIGVIIDITERKRADEELRKSETALQRNQEQLRALAAELIDAQDKERRRLSRELHDDLNQKVASLVVDIQGLQRGLLAAPQLIERLQLLRDRALGLSKDIHRLAYQLHPSILDDLGLAIALEHFIRDFSSRNEVRVKFTHRNLPDSFPQEVASCLYRVTQECLQNVAKHARAAHVAIKLEGRDNGIHLSIKDDGVGFDPDILKEHREGLGVIGMQERLRLVDGSFSVTSRPGHGTTVAAWVPLPKSTS